MAYWLEGARARPVARPRRQDQNSASGFTLVHTSRARLRFALLICLGAAALLGYVVFPPHRIAVQADGSERVVLSRTSDPNALLKMAGVDPQVGDVVVQDSGRVQVERAVPVLVRVDGQTLAWRTRATTVKGVLDEMGVEAGPYDGLLYDGFEVGLNESLSPGPFAAARIGQGGLIGELGTRDKIELAVRRAVPLTIIEDGQAIAFKSSRPTLAMALRDAGIRLGPADEVYPSPSSALVAGLQVSVKHASAISLRMGATTRVIYTQRNTLGEALAELGLSLGADDRVEPAVDAQVTNGMTARLVRVAGRQMVERQQIARKTVFKPDESLSGSSSRIVQGHDGVHYTEYRVVIEDGVETERKLIREWYDPERVDTVIYYAASTLRATGLPPENLNVIKIERMYATWYNAASSGRPATDPSYGMTASGVPVIRGIVAVDPAVIPLGTRLYIPGYGFAIAADTGGGIVGNMIDLGYPEGVDVDWHTGWVDVFVLAP